MEKSEAVLEVEKIIKESCTKGALIRANLKMDSYMEDNKMSMDEYQVLRTVLKKQKKDILTGMKNGKEIQDSQCNVAYLVTKARLDKGLRIGELASISGVSATIISKIENESIGYRPTYAKLKKLKEVLEIDTVALHQAILLNHEWACRFWADMNEGEEFVSIGEMLRYLRIKRNYTITDVCKQTGFYQSHVTRIEVGKFDSTPLETIRKFLKCYDVDEDEFFDMLVKESNSRKQFI